MTQEMTHSVKTGVIHGFMTQEMTQGKMREDKYRQFIELAE